VSGSQGTKGAPSSGVRQCPAVGGVSERGAAPRQSAAVAGVAGVGVSSGSTTPADARVRTVNPRANATASDRLMRRALRVVKKAWTPAKEALGSVAR
jgi:hypothetical protein